MRYIKKDDWDREWARQVSHGWDVDFKTPEQYTNFKLDMLRKEMYINPTEDEIKHLRTLKTCGDIDRAVHSIIDRHWG